MPGNGPWKSGAGWASTARFLARQGEEFVGGRGATRRTPPVPSTRAGAEPPRATAAAHHFRRSSATSILLSLDRARRKIQSRISTNSPSTWPKARLQSGHRQSPWRSSAFVGSTHDSSDLVMVVKSMRHLTMSTIAPIVHPDSIPVNLQSVSPMRSGAAPTTRECGTGQGVEGKTYFTVPFFWTRSEDCE
jgi:hypothetical protein